VLQDVAAERDDRYHRLKLIRWWDQRRLRDARILVVGAGALGNELLKHLALVGVGHVVVCDFDAVEPSNLSRTVLFRADDAGASKARTAAARVRDLNPDVEVAWLHGDVGTDIGLGVFRRTDVVLGGVDNVEARVAVNSACWRTATPYVDGGTHAFEGQVRVFAAPQGPCYECVLTDEHYERMRERIRCNLLVELDPGAAEGKVATTSIASSIIAALQVQQAIGLVHGVEPLRGQTIVFNGPTNETYLSSYGPRDTAHHVHSQLPPPMEVVELPDASASMPARDLLAMVRGRVGRDVTVHLSRETVVGLSCRACRRNDPVLLPLGRLRGHHLACPACGAERTFRTRNSIEAGARDLDRPLLEHGVPALDVVFAFDGERGHHFELTGDLPPGGVLRGELSTPPWRAGERGRA
jgi:adenylyltransferase/sulfurtransferase